MKRRTVVKGLGLAGVGLFNPGFQGLKDEALKEEAASTTSSSNLRSKPLNPGTRPEEPGAYELRVYTAAEGKLPDLLKRFREHTRHLFERHGMKNVAYWTATDESKKANTLIYILKYPSRDAATASWKAFQDDPEWQQVKNKSEENGKLVEKVDSTFMVLTDFSKSIG